MLGTWLVAFQAIRLDGGWCFKGVHLSQVHQQSNIEVIPAWMVHLRQVHPLKVTLARLVHFLLWQAAKPSGDKCTP